MYNHFESLTKKFANRHYLIMK